MRLSSTATGTADFGKEPWSQTFLACEKAGCHTHFNRNKGYVDIRDSRIIEHKQNWCRDHKEPKAIVALREGKSIWQCFHEECLNRKNILGQIITVGQTVMALHPKHGRFRVRSIGEDGFAILQGVGTRGESDFLMDHWEEIPIDGLSPYVMSTAR